jgi:hypothetical protein
MEPRDRFRAAEPAQGGQLPAREAPAPPSPMEA